MSPRKENEVECDLGDGPSRFPSLKAVANTICGYTPSVGGWTFFFGAMTREEVAARYGTAHTTDRT